MTNTLTSAYITDIKDILSRARQNAYRAVQSEMVSAYWRIGERIVQEEQRGEARAQYGKEIIKTLSAELTREFGKGFGTRNLWEMRKFYLNFQDIKIVQTLFAQLSWSHFQRVFKILRFPPPHPSPASRGGCHKERLCHP